MLYFGEYIKFHGVPGLEHFQIWISIPFSFIYLLAVIGNGLVMTVVAWDRSLHEPMYLFLAMPALNDVLLCTVTVPQMLLIFWQGPSLVMFPACLAQMIFVHSLFLSESAVLLAMAFDRYVAICIPLHYTTLLTGSLIGKVGLALVARSVSVVTPGVFLILRLHFCRSNIIHHTYCEHMGIAKLACNNIAPNSIHGLTAALLTTGLDFVFISLSYWLILRTVFQLPSRQARKKAFGTCGAHLCVILIFYTLAFFSFFTHRFGHHVPRHTLILLANLYLLIPPTMNPIVYGIKTKEIRIHVLGICSQLKSYTKKQRCVECMKKILISSLGYIYTHNTKALKRTLKIFVSNAIFLMCSLQKTGLYIQWNVRITEFNI